MAMVMENVKNEAVIVGGLVGVQLFFAANSVLLGYLMTLGLKPFTIVFSSPLQPSFLSFLLLFILKGSFSLFFWSKWPKQLTLKLMIRLLLISFAGVSLFQLLFLKGVNLASPALATAMPNLAPGLIFIIAWTCRLEKVDLSCLYSKVKIAGTILCVLGGLTMSLMQSTVSPNDATFMPSQTNDPHRHTVFDRDKIVGCSYLVAAVLVLSINVVLLVYMIIFVLQNHQWYCFPFVLQATTLVDLPAPTSLRAITSLIGMIVTAVLQLVQDHSLQWSSPLVSVKDLISFSLLGGAMGRACLSFNGWEIKKRGPVLVSMFSPIGTVIAVLSVITLGGTISLGSIAGMFLMFTGLYVVLWAKKREHYCNIEEAVDPEKLLLK
ncbi:WAT1-related protein At5g47470-like [Hibiscus syriacus]|uniref:WAT1-related protein At5g47470-like n=1 Tax=Hibiscus syriacus TaxID=106335 RepID=UPI0019242F26|nr:WAT1-related protein At5g47470-like [Hibiscus syriacus]